MSRLLRRALAIVLAVGIPVAGGAEESFRLHPEFQARLAGVKTVGVVAPVLKLYELTAGNNRVYKPDWSDQAATNVARGLESAFRARGLEVKPVAPGTGGAGELREVRLLFETVVGAVIQATYANQFPAKMARFEYSLGDLQALLSAEGVDVLVFAYGFGNISSGGRTALQVLGAVLGGGYSVGVDRLFIALVDRSGAVLWFDTEASTSGNLRDAGSAASFVSKMTGHLPGVKR